MITSNLLQSPRIAHSPGVRIGVLNCPLFPFNGCLTPQCNRLQRNVLNCSSLREIEHIAVTIDVIKRIYTNFYEFYGALSDDAYIGPKSRTERPRKTKIGSSPRHTWLGQHFQGQKIKGKLAEGGAYCGGLQHSLFQLESKCYTGFLKHIHLLTVQQNKCLLLISGDGEVRPGGDMWKHGNEGYIITIARYSSLYNNTTIHCLH